MAFGLFAVARTVPKKLLLGIGFLMRVQPFAVNLNARILIVIQTFVKRLISVVTMIEDFGWL